MQALCNEIVEFAGLCDGLQLIFPTVHTVRGVMFVLREKRSSMRLSYAVDCDGCEVLAK